jgi:hypothetical protein
MNHTLRLRPAMAAFALVMAPAVARAQDTTRVRADSAAARSDSVNVPRLRAPPPVAPAWRFQIDFGFQDLTGNRDLTVVNGAFVVERRRQDRFILNFKLEGRFGRSNGVESVNQQLARLRFDWQPKARLSPFLGLDLARDPIRKVAVRAQVGAGANINVDTRPEARTYFSLGFVQDHQEFTAGTLPTSSDDTRWMVRAATTRLLGQTTRIESIARYQPSTRGVADYLATFEASVRVSLTRRMGFTTKYEFIRDSRPATGVKTDDRALTAALSFAW